MSRVLQGDWQSLKRVLDSASPTLKRESCRRIGKLLKTTEAKVLGHLDNQDLNWKPLTDAYKDHKDRKNLSPDTLRATNQMYSNITTAQEDDYSGAVGVKRGVKEKNGGDLTDIALIHEQPKDDGKIIPARKLWKPTFEEISPKAEAELKGIAIEVFKKR